MPVGDRSVAAGRSAASVPRPAPTIGLAMIVRDEAAVVERLIASVRPVIDTWTVVDTGSVDDTPALVAAALADRPGTVHHRPWVDFGHNRTELLDLAAGTADHLLLLDADMTLVVHGPLPTLDHDVYRIRTEGHLAYWVPRLVRGDRPGRYVGATHEYLDSGPGATTADLTAWTITHHADGGSRADKFTRDRGLLVAAWERRPTRVEPLHELARGHRARGEHHAARLFAERGLGIAEPADLLFVHRDVYRWRLRFEHAIASYWVGDVDGALATNEALLADPDLPEDLAPYVADTGGGAGRRSGPGPRLGPDR